MATQKGRNWSSGDIVTAANLSSIERGVSAVAEEYTPTTWANGDTVTAAALNNIEQGIANASDGETWATLTEESVTTVKPSESLPHAVGEFTYSEPITADTIKVTFNGTEYTCEKISSSNGNAYGGIDSTGPDFSEYPFAIASVVDGNNIFTETAGTYSIKIEAPAESGSSDFSTAKLTYSGVEQIYISRIYADGDNTLVTPIIADPGTYDVVLYNGVAYGDLDRVLGNVSVDGAIEYDDGGVIITGDCTITISHSSSGPIK